MIVGAHARNEARITDEDVRLSKVADFEGALIMYYTGPESAARFGLDPAKCIVRLPDSVYKSWPSGSEYIPHWSQYAQDCLEIIASYYEHGYRLFQVDNEPNLTWASHDLGAWNWAWFMEKALFDGAEGLRRRLRDEDLKDVRLGFTPLAHPNESVEWLLAAHHNNLINRCDWVAAHCYWQRYTDMFSEQFGTSFAWLHRRTFKLPIYITECGNSMIHQNPVPSLTTVRARQAKEYPEYLRWCTRYPYVMGTYFFILGHNGDWKGFDLTESVCRGIGTFEQRGGGAGGSSDHAV